MIHYMTRNNGGFPGSPVVKGPPSNAGDASSLVEELRTHMPPAAKPSMQLLSLRTLEPVRQLECRKEPPCKENSRRPQLRTHAAKYII